MLCMVYCIVKYISELNKGKRKKISRGHEGIGCDDTLIEYCNE